MTQACYRPIWLVYVIIYLGSFSTFCLNPLKTEFIYMKVAGSHNTTKKALTSCENDNSTEADVLVAQDASRWTLLFDLTMFLPASAAGLIVTSWSDRVGRRIAMVVPLLAMTSSSIFLAVMIKTNLSLPWMYLYNVIAGAGGYYMTLLMQGYAYLSDITIAEKRGFRFTVLETFLGVGGGVGGVAGGYWVNARGFFEPVVCTVAMGIVCLLLIFLLPSSEKIKQEQNKEEADDSARCDDDIEDMVTSQTGSGKPSYGSIDVRTPNDDDNIKEEERRYDQWKITSLMRTVWRVYSSEFSHCKTCHGTLEEMSELERRTQGLERCPHGGGVYPGRVWRLWFYLGAYDLYMFIVVGGMAFLTLYLLTTPLCFSTELVGLMMGVKFALLTLIPLTVVFYQKVLRISNDVIIVLGLAGQAMGCVTMSFAFQPFIAFIGTSTILVSGAAKPFIQAQISSLVSKDEQGSAFALLSSTEVLTFMTATVSFLTLYPATVELFHGFAWAVAACVDVIPITLILIIVFKDRRGNQPRGGDREPIVS